MIKARGINWKVVGSNPTSDSRSQKQNPPMLNTSDLVATVFLKFVDINTLNGRNGCAMFFFFLMYYAFYLLLNCSGKALNLILPKQFDV